LIGAGKPRTIGDIVGEPAFDTPTRLGRYEVIRHLATGGMAEVLLARGHDAAGQLRHVVIKRIRPDQARDHRFVQMFLDEARIAALLQHPNIVQVFDISNAQEGECFFAMEYVHGEDLRRVLAEVHRRRDKLPIALVTGLVAGAAAGLHHAHTQVGPDRRPLGIVHRDVSPANILVGYDGGVKVTDFGIAKAALRTVETRSGTLKGKVSYMSPEQVTGKEIDRRSDVFALGIVLYEVATARRLFKGDNDFLTMSAIVQGDIPRPSELRPDLPRILEDIIMTALSANPKDRFQTAEELRSELEAFTTSLGMRMSPSNIADYMKKLFGHKAEPWLVDDDPTLAGDTYDAITIDFDGAEGGVVRTPNVVVKNHGFPPALKAAPRSPIAFALESAGGAAAPPPETTSEGKAYGSNGTSTGMAWVNEASRVAPKRSRGRVLAMALAAAAAAGGGMYGVMKMSGGDDEVKAAKAPPPAEAPVARIEVKAAPAKPEPEPEPVKIDPKQLEADKQEAARLAKLEAAKAEADQRETDRLAKLAAAKAEADQRETNRLAKLEAARIAKDEAAKAQAAKLEAAKADAAKKAEAARIAKAEAAKAQAARLEAAKADAAKKAEAARIAKAEAARRAEADRIAKAEAAKKADAAKIAAKSPPKAPPAKPTKPAGNGSAWDPNALFAPK
jgi:serine/threonine-protein kinase